MKLYTALVVVVQHHHRRGGRRGQGRKDVQAKRSPKLNHTVLQNFFIVSSGSSHNRFLLVERTKLRVDKVPCVGEGETKEVDEEMRSFVSLAFPPLLSSLIPSPPTPHPLSNAVPIPLHSRVVDATMGGAISHPSKEAGLGLGLGQGSTVPAQGGPATPHQQEQEREQQPQKEKGDGHHHWTGAGKGEGAAAAEREKGTLDLSLLMFVDPLVLVRGDNLDGDIIGCNRQCQELFPTLEINNDKALQDYFSFQECCQTGVTVCTLLNGNTRLSSRDLVSGEQNILSPERARPCPAGLCHFLVTRVGAQALASGEQCSLVVMQKATACPAGAAGVRCKQAKENSARHAKRATASTEAFRDRKLSNPHPVPAQRNKSLPLLNFVAKAKKGTIIVPQKPESRSSEFRVGTYVRRKGGEALLNHSLKNKMASAVMVLEMVREGIELKNIDTELRHAHLHLQEGTSKFSTPFLRSLFLPFFYIT